MKQFNCAGLNATFNVAGPNYILIKEIDCIQDQVIMPANAKKGTSIKLKRKDTIRTIIKKDDNSILYFKEEDTTTKYHSEMIDSYIQDYINRARKEQAMIIRNYDIEYKSLHYNPTPEEKSKEKKMIVVRKDIENFYKLTKKQNIAKKCKNVDWWII